MSLNNTNTANDIVAKITGINADTDQTQAKAMWEAIIDALYTRLKADLQITSIVATGIPVATAGGPAAQTGATTAPGEADSSVIS